MQNLPIWRMNVPAAIFVLALHHWQHKLQIMRKISLRWLSKPKQQTPDLDHPKTDNSIFLQRLRLGSGLTLMIYVMLHYINHSLGNISINAMNYMLDWQILVWQSFPGSLLLYGALLTHIVLILWKLVARKTFRLPVWEWIQIILGLLIPYFILTHIIAMRSPVRELGISVDYSLAFGMMWPGAAYAQNFLLLVTWVHGCLGLHFWLRLRSWYGENIGWLASLAVVLPTLALTGWVNAARHNFTHLQTLRIDNPDEAAAFDNTIQYIYSSIIPKIEDGNFLVLGLGMAVLIMIALYQIAQRFKKRMKIDYGNGVVVTSFPGNTILEISRQAGIPHMSVCGGRARCSTCRTLIVSGNDNLQPKTDAEVKLLDRLNADQSIRLACQAKVSGDVTVRPLVQPQDQIVTPRHSDPLGWGVERSIAIMFLDIRGFSRISEKSLPYDVVFILNSFFGEVTTAVEANNGYVDKFMGDGMMALFGLECDENEAARNAILAAIDCEKAAKNVSRILTQHLAEPIKIGIGIHVGDAVIGRIGKTSDQNSPSRLTAIGDSVNISARLEQATKEFATPLVISQKSAKLAGLSDMEKLGTNTEIIVRNISNPVKILAVDDLELLAKTLT